MNKRSKRETFRRLILPMIVLIIINVVCGFICGEFKDYGYSFEGNFMTIGSHIVFQLIVQVLAFITCWAFVLRKDKSNAHIWVNYIVWAIIMNLGRLAEAGIIK